MVVANTLLVKIILLKNQSLAEAYSAILREPPHLAFGHLVP